jgi:hypothetical protein
MGEAGADGEGVWWRMTLDCPELALAYRGGVRRLAHAVREMVAGRTVVITTVAHGAQGRGSFSDVVFNSLQAGGPVAMQRLRAGLFMPGTIYGIDERSPWFVGLGADLEGAEVKKGLASAEKWERVEAVDEVRRAGEVPAALRERVVGLLKDPEAVVRVHAAVAVLAEHADHAEARGVLVEGLRDESEEVRREAARCVGRVGTRAGFAVGDLVEALGRAKGEDEKVAVVEAMGLVGDSSGSGKQPPPLPSPGVPGEGEKGRIASKTGRSGGGLDEEGVQAFGEGGGVFDFAAFGDDGLGVEEVGEGFEAVVGGVLFEEGVQRLHCGVVGVEFEDALGLG